MKASGLPASLTLPLPCRAHSGLAAGIARLVRSNASRIPNLAPRSLSRRARGDPRVASATFTLIASALPLDLFLHSADVTLRNAVIAALCARDAEAMRVAMDRLLAEFPNDLNNDDFELLFSELSALSQQAGSTSAIAQRVERIETHWRPALQ